MQCSCGGDSQSGNANNKALGIHLDFVVCNRCGRVAHEILYVGGGVHAQGMEARRLYQQALDTQSLPPAPKPVKTPKAAETPSLPPKLTTEAVQGELF